MTIEAILERIAVALERQAGVEPVKRGPGRPPKVEAEAAPTPRPAPKPAPKPPVEDDFDDAPAPAYTADDVRTALVGYQKSSGSPEQARKLLKDVGGADTLRTLSADKYAAVIDACKAAS